MAKLQKGVNDLKTWCINNGSFGQQLISEWTGLCEDGKHYKIDQVARASHKKFKWKCSKGHEWFVKVNDRTAYKTDCPYCYNVNRSEIAAKAKLSNENSLKEWCLSYGSFGKQLMSEWTGECTDGKHYKIDEVAKASHKRFKWRCSRDHEWTAQIISRTSYKTGCPYCYNANRGEINAKAKLSEENSLKTWCLSNGEFGQKLMSEWTGIREDGKHYKIDEVSFGSSHKKNKWICSKCHEWTAQIISRTLCKSECPYCSGHCVSNENSLKTWCLNNGAFGEQLMSEWTGECEDGNHYSIDQISFGSNKKFKWKCFKGHEWFARIANRTAHKSGCPCCNTYGTSYAEQFIYYSLKQIFPNTENRCKVLKSSQNAKGIEFDIGVPEIPLCIEYSPTRWHEGNEERDQYKKDLCQKANVRLIQIIEDSYDELPFKMEADYICFKMDYRHKDEILEIIVDRILKSLGHSISEIDIELVKKNAWDYSKNKIEYEKSLAGVYPELAKEWHPTLNNNLKPDEIKCGSNKIVYWQCPKCNHGENGGWQAMIYNRAHGKTGCPKCDHNWYKT